MTTKRDQIAKQIRALIVSGEISRGDRIMQDKLAERFGTSITPVREALLLLEAEGVLVGEPHRGLRVAEADVQQLKAVYIMRHLSERHAMRRATLRMSRLDLDTARRLIDEMGDALEGERLAEVGKLNRAFHFLFFERCGIPEFAREVDALWLSFPWDILQVLEDRPGESIKEHRAILSAVESGDLDAVDAATSQHLWASYRSLMIYLTGETPRDPLDITVD